MKIVVPRPRAASLASRIRRPTVFARRTRGAAAGRAVNTKTPIVIFGLSRGVFHHGALGIARSAGRLGIPVHRICRESWAPARLSRYSRSWSRIPEDATPAEILDFLHASAAAWGRALLIPIDDAASVFVDERGESLEQDFLLSAPAIRLGTGALQQAGNV